MRLHACAHRALRRASSVRNTSVPAADARHLRMFVLCSLHALSPTPARTRSREGVQRSLLSDCLTAPPPLCPQPVSPLSGARHLHVPTQPRRAGGAQTKGSLGSGAQTVSSKCLLSWSALLRCECLPSRVAAGHAQLSLACGCFTRTPVHSCMCVLYLLAHMVGHTCA